MKTRRRKRKSTRIPKAPCLTPGCDGTYNNPRVPIHRRGARGLCYHCYFSAVRAISRGETSWEQLEQMGLLRPRNHRALLNALKSRKQNVPLGMGSP